jgi:hypothetical protein
MPKAKINKYVLIGFSNYLKLCIYLVSTKINGLGGVSAVAYFDTEVRYNGRVDSAFQLPCR